MKFTIIPTGDEVKNGIVLDTNTPAIISIILEKFPQAFICRMPPVSDKAEEIKKIILNQKQEPQLAADIIIVIGGSGGGQVFDPDLAPDVTHAALESIIKEPVSREIYGYNGHLWCRLVIGSIGKTLIANVPGPYVEAIAATEKLVQGVFQKLPAESILAGMSQAVFDLYPAGGFIK